MPGHALRGLATAGLVIIVIEKLATSGTGRVGAFFTDASGIVQRAFSPKVPLIPDRRAGAAKPADTGGYFTGLTKDQNQAINDAQHIVPGTPQAIAKAAHDPNSLLNHLTSLNLTGLDHLAAYGR
jgi:hypothetical protein